MRTCGLWDCRFGTQVVSSVLCNALLCRSKVILLWRCCMLVKAPLGVGDLNEFLPCKGISVRRVWPRTPCPELKINWWLKSGSNPLRSSFPFSTRIGWRWPWVANFWKPSVAQFFMKLSELVFPKFCELLVNVWFANCDFFLDHILKTLRDSCQAMFDSRNGEGVFLGKSKANVLLDV